MSHVHVFHFLFYFKNVGTYASDIFQKIYPRTYKNMFIQCSHIFKSIVVINNGPRFDICLIFWKFQTCPKKCCNMSGIINSPLGNNYNPKNIKRTLKKNRNIKKTPNSFAVFWALLDFFLGY